MHPSFLLLGDKHLPDWTHDVLKVMQNWHMTDEYDWSLPTKWATREVADRIISYGWREKFLVDTTDADRLSLTIQRTLSSTISQQNINHESDKVNMRRLMKRNFAICIGWIAFVFVAAKPVQLIPKMQTFKKRRTGCRCQTRCSHLVTKIPRPTYSVSLKWLWV